MVIPSYRTRNHIIQVIESIGPEVEQIIVIDDKCPEKSGELVEERNTDKRVRVIYNSINLGVGGSTVIGYKLAVQSDADIVVKLDGDGQMDPKLIPDLIKPIEEGHSDYVKGNRFWSLDHVRQMPKIRLIGNLILSFFAKASTGYWNLFDPNNGLTAIDVRMLRKLPLDRIEKRYFFESDILFRLYIEGARTSQISMYSKYGSEKSSLKIHKVIFEFTGKHFRNLFKRVLYTYFLRDFSFASVNFLLGLSLLCFSLFTGLKSWIVNSQLNTSTEIGTQILVAITFISGLQMFLSFVNSDVDRTPK